MKVQNSDGSLRGYLAKSGDLVGLYRTWSTDPEGAILISFTTSPSGEAFEVQIIVSLFKSSLLRPTYIRRHLVTLNRTTPKVRKLMTALRSAGKVSVIINGKPTPHSEIFLWKQKLEIMDTRITALQAPAHSQQYQPNPGRLPRRLTQSRKMMNSMPNTLRKAGVGSQNDPHGSYPETLTGFERLQPFIRQYANRIHWLRPSGLDEDDHVPVVSIGQLPARALI